MNRNNKRRASKPRSNSIHYRYDPEIKRLQEKYEAGLESKKVISFEDFPLSQNTLKGLADAKYNQPTNIQRGSIFPALLGKDVLGAAETGSGKTLAFLIPVLEHLFMNKWSRTDGICAIIISPTRELAYQIFETLRKIGKYHDFSAGLVIGGKNLKFERRRMDQCNILICTPGRLLQHMDENPLFNASTMELLVLDEADRCLDMGFKDTISSIIENFPPKRQTLLFSATQTTSVQDLARLNLTEPICIGVEENELAATLPDLLQQNYVVIELHDKITMLWSFIKNHLKQKIIVFLSTCKQVKYVFEIFCKLRPGVSLLALYGTLHQDRRITIYNDFLRRNNVILFATDVASRGLDFPSVNWVVQLDCPEDISQYIHRAGRSARNKARGESLLVLMPTEEKGMVAEFEKKFIKIQKIQIDPKKLFSPRIKMEAYLAQNSELKASAQRAFISYIKSVFLMKNKHIFNVFKLDFDAYAKSLGLVITPRVPFLEKFIGTQQFKENKKVSSKSLELINSKSSNSFVVQSIGSDSDDDDLFKVKRLDHDISNNEEENIGQSQLLGECKKSKLVTKAALAKKVLKKKIQTNEKRKFDEEGNEISDVRKQLQSELARKYAEKLEEHGDVVGGIDIEESIKLLTEEDKFDKQRFRKLVKLRHKKLKEKFRIQENRSKDEDNYSTGEESDNSVDLSWLPNPNKLFKNANTRKSSESENDNTNEFTANNNSSEGDGDLPTKRAKLTSEMTLQDAEYIASQLIAQADETCQLY